MEWDFEVKDVVRGKVEYGLEDFVRDLKEEVEINFGDMSVEKKEYLFKAFYRFMHFSVIGSEKEKMKEWLKLDDDGYDIMVGMLEDNMKMLEAIHMSMFLGNLQASKGFISERDNFRLLNDRLRRFHLKHNL